MLDFVKEMLPLLTAALTGGFISSGITSYFNARLEERRDTRKRRLDMVETWRKELLTDIEANPFGAGYHGWSYSFERQPSYTTLFPLLSPSLLQSLSKGYTGGASPELHCSMIRMSLSSEISRIEQKWKLI